MRLTRRTSALILACALVALAGCSAGQNSQTAAKRPAVSGVNADLGGISLRNVQVGFTDREHRSYPEGGQAPLDVRIFNTGAEADSLVAVTSQVADSVRLVGKADEAATVCPAAEVSVPATAAPTESPESPEESPAGSPSPTAEPEAEPEGTETFSVDLAPGDCALLQAERPYHLVLTGLKQEVAPGLTVPITFRFAKAGEVTLDVPFGMPADGAHHSPLNMHPEEPHVVGGGPKHGEGEAGHE